VGKQARGLQCIANALAQLWQTRVIDRGTERLDPAGFGNQQSVYEVQQGRFATAACTEQRCCFAGQNIQTDGVQCQRVAECLGHILKPDRAHEYSSMKSFAQKAVGQKAVGQKACRKKPDRQFTCQGAYQGT
jgi:hypothetical protein